MKKEEFIESIRLEGEEWRDVVGYEDDYMVSNLGRIAMVRTFYVYSRNGRSFTKRCVPHICSTSIAPSTPYRRMTFVKNGEKETQLLHRIIAMAFLPNPDGLPCVDHIDDNPSNSIASNLQWCTYKTNNSKEHHRTATSESKKGVPAYNRTAIVKLSKDMDLVKIYSSMTQAELEGFSHSAIHRVAHNKLKTHGGFKWMYLSDYEKLLSNQLSKNASPND